MSDRDGQKDRPSTAPPGSDGKSSPDQSSPRRSSPPKSTEQRKTSRAGVAAGDGESTSHRPARADRRSRRVIDVAPSNVRRKRKTTRPPPASANTADAIKSVSAPAYDDEGDDTFVGLVPGYDLDEDAAFIAPIGPTELVLPDEETIDDEAPGPRSVRELEQQIKELEAKLDNLLETHDAAKPTKKPSVLPPSSVSITSPAPEAVNDLKKDIAPIEDTAPNEDAAQGHAPPRDVVAGHRYLQGWGRTAMRGRAEDVDEFGLDADYDKRARPLLDFLHRYYFRSDVEGASHVPTEGRCLIVGNHSGGPVPYDGLMLRTALRRDHPTHREVRWLAEDFIYYLPFIGATMTRLGAIRACRENAERVLKTNGALVAFPEGEKGIGKLFRERYQLQRFGRGGYVKLGLRSRAPIIPVAIVGAEEANPLLYRVRYMAKTLGLPYLPVTPTFPALGPLGLLPAPTKWKVRFGEPIHLDSYGPQAAEDELLVRRISEQVRGTIQEMVRDLLQNRRSVWFG